MSPDEPTEVARPAGPQGPRRGEVIGERYEVRGRLRNDAFSRGLLAFDQEEEIPVLLRVIRPEIIPASERSSVVARLRSAIGVGGSYLPGILDADRDGERVFTTEPLPEGALFRDVLDRRIASKRPLKPYELLPLVAHLEAALLALPSHLVHGDVRAENVWTDTERLQLTGAFLLPSIASHASAIIKRNSGLRRRLAPEVALGQGEPGSDRYGVASIAYEALTLAAPHEDGRCDDLPPGPLRECLEELLTPIRSDREQSLSGLVEVLAQLAGLPVPQLEPAPFEERREYRMRSSAVPPALMASEATRPELSSMMQAHTDVLAAPPMAEEDGLPPAPIINENDRTQPRASLSKIRSDGQKRAEEAAAATAALRAKKRALSEAERRTRAKAAGLDPRLVRAALAEDEEGSHHIEGADTRDSGDQFDPASGPPDGAAPSPELAPPNAAPPAPALGSKRGQLELASNSGRTSEGVEMDPSVPVEAASGGTQEIAFDELELASEEAPLGLDSEAAMGLVDFPASEEVPLDPSVPVTAAKGGTQEISFDELDQMEREAGGGDPAPSLQLTDLAGMSPVLHTPPVGVLLQPKVQLPGAQEALAFGDANPRRSPIPMVARPLEVPVLEPRSLEYVDPAQPAAAPFVTEATTSPGAAKHRRSAKTQEMRAPVRRRNDHWIIALAMIVGALVIVGILSFAKYKRAQHRQELYQDLQRQ